MQFNFIENNSPYSINIVENKLFKFSAIEVDRLWNLSKQKNKYLFNDDIFYVDSIKENKIYGYFAEYKSCEIKPDKVEIDQAVCFDINNLPNVPPSNISISGKLIEAYINKFN